MGESAVHAKLVKMLAQWIATAYLQGDYSYMLIDDAYSKVQTKPPKIYEYIPDIYVPHAPSGELIIGEAKISRDIENTHTTEQIKAFLHKCSEETGSLLIFAVPWYVSRLMRSMVENIKIKSGFKDVKTEVIDKLPDYI